MLLYLLVRCGLYDAEDGLPLADLVANLEFLPSVRSARVNDDASDFSDHPALLDLIHSLVLMAHRRVIGRLPRHFIGTALLHVGLECLDPLRPRLLLKHVKLRTGALKSGLGFLNQLTCA